MCAWGEEGECVRGVKRVRVRDSMRHAVHRGHIGQQAGRLLRLRLQRGVQDDQFAGLTNERRPSLQREYTPGVRT